MKKILVIHTNYQSLGGEDVAVDNEVELLKENYEVETLYFSNNINQYFSQFISFISIGTKLVKKDLKKYYLNLSLILCTFIILGLKLL